MNRKKHLDYFLAIFNIHLVMEDDVIVRAFLQALVGLVYD